MSFRDDTDCYEERRTNDEAEAGEDEYAIDRDERFVETTEHSEFIQSGEYKNLKPYYSGSVLDDRNAEIRKSIYYIRQNWDRYAEFTQSLKNVFFANEKVLEFTDKTTEEDFKRLFSKQRRCLTEADFETTELTYEALRLYTSDEGYKRIYRLCNHVFRDENCLVSIEEIRAAVFLVELISIDLYNLCLARPEKTNFQGTVWRGMVLGEEDFSLFRTLRNAPIHGRNIAVPLVLFSASSSIKVARRFINHRMKEAEKEGKQLHPVVYRINIIGLKPEYIVHFKLRFPELTLTTIGAVDIHDISRHPSEKEVIIRGPFTLILDVYDDEGSLMGRPSTVLEGLAITSNRDHITTSVSGPTDDLAREMVAAMVTVTRAEYCVRYYRDKNLADDEAEFAKIFADGKKRLNELWNVGVDEFARWKERK